MKKLIYILFSIILAVTHSYSQGGFKRQFKLPFSKNNSTQAVFETTPNNYIMCGLVVDTLNNYQTNRLTLVGLNSQGQPQWVKKYGNKKFEYLDNTIITKWFYKQGNYLYHAGCVRDSNNKQLGVFIKFNFNGDTLWQKRFYEAGYDVIPQQVIGSADGGFLITGWFQNVTTSPVLIIKTDANGNELWRKMINKAVPNTQDAKVIVQDSATKKIVTVGYQYIGNANAFAGYANILITDSLGNKLSQVTYPSGIEGVLRDVIQTQDKKFVAIGNVKTPLLIGALETYKSYIVKFDINAPNTPIWQKQIDIASPNNGFNTIKELSNGDLIVGGVLDTNLQHNLNYNNLNRLIRMDKNGNELWKKYYNYQTNAPAYNIQDMLSLNLTLDGSFIVAINSYNNPNPNPFFVVKYDSTGCDSSAFYCSTVGIKENSFLSEVVKVYPNPTNGILNIEVENANKIKVVNVLGELVKHEDLKIGRAHV